MAKETITKTIKFEKELADKIKEMGEEKERQFSQQVRFMLQEYIKLIENK